ncbi:MAG: hypothetical protein H6907_18020 [Hyphomicrobiales bacterium]|nr:hypothetical protein [Hyphomicrobiales bacterium]MCP5373631.1 hypothetical protein [Hyphomicrobiales bacterium]
MSSRIANLAANNQLISYLLRTQSRLHQTEVQIATEKVSQDYAGINRESQRLLNIENTRATLERYTQNNELLDLQLEITETTLEGIEGTIHDFREQLFLYESGSLEDEQRVKDIQDAAMRALLDMEVHLNTDVGGRFLFSGTRVTTQPVDLNTDSLADFQAEYDGEAVVYPITRDAHVGTNLTTDATVTGALTFSGGDTITAANAGTLSSISVGSQITLAGSAANDGTYTVVSNDGTNITISGTIAGTAVTVTNTVTNGGPDAGVTIAASSYYSGDSIATTHRVEDDRSITLDLTGIDPAFEKAIRAMGIIAQGVFGTNGGLDQHPERIDQALYLLTSSLEPPGVGTPPFGTEETSNMSQVENDFGYHRVLVDQINTRHASLIGFFEQRVADVENVDNLEATTRLLDDSQALEASYQALARIKQLSLTNFL